LLKIFSSFSKISTYKHEILLFLIIFTISSSIPIFQYSVWETSDERIKHQSLALFSGDEPFYFEITSSITRNHSLNLDAHFMSKERDPFFEFPPLFYEVSSCRLHHSLTAADGHCYIQNVGLPLILSPGYYIGGVVGSLLLLCTLLSIQGIVFYKISNHFTTKNLGLFLSILISLSTMLLSFSTNVYPDFMGGFFLLLILYFFFFRKNNFLNLTISGTLLAFLPFLKLTFLIFPIILLPIMTFVLLSKRNYNNTFHLIASFLILILIYYSLIMFIAPIEISPGVGGGYKQFFIDSLSSGSGLSVFLDNYINGLERYLFGQSYGLFLYSPLALLSIFGIKYIWNYNKFLSLSIIIAAFSFISAHSILAPFGGGWTLPGRYVIPILPILLISLFPLFEKFKKNIIFHAIILGCSYVGVSLNIIFARTIFGHFLNDERINILNPIYFGLAQVFPKLVLDLDKLWNLHVGPIFSIFIIFLFSVLIFFTFSSFFKKILLTKNKKILFFVGLCVLYGSIFYYIYDDGSKYYTESQVSELFDELLKRQPTNEEMNYWKNSLLTNTITSNEMRNSLINSDEGKIVNEISKIYKEILQREPDSSGLDHWKEKIINNEISFKELETIIRNSAEGIKNNAN
jgi:hypothetical protein